MPRTLCHELTKDFSGRILLLGFGTIGRCLLPMLRDQFAVQSDRYLVVDGDDHTGDFAPHRGAGISYRVAPLDKDNIDAVFAPLLRAGDILINTTIGVDSVTLIDWCQKNGVAYVDSSLEPWDEEIWDLEIAPHARTEYAYHQRARQHARKKWPQKGPTAVVCHGANPGLVSHFVKAALQDIAAALEMNEAPPARRNEWAQLARQTGTKVIHISERDTQVSAESKRPDEFVNTWSIPGLVEEASMPFEAGWGTHEKKLPPGAQHHAAGPRNAIYADGPAARVLIRSWVPLGGQIAGLAVPHSESVTISEYFTLTDNGDATYRPTVIFAYLPCDAALASLHETMMRDWRMQSHERIMTDDIIAGRDELGVLLMGHDLGAWWYGSQLDIEETRRLAPGCNPTAVQVAAGVLAAAAWTAANPSKGYCEPEALPHDQVLEIARPYLGPMQSAASDWTPLATRARLYEAPLADLGDPWQFGNFVLSWPLLNESLK